MPPNMTFKRDTLLGSPDCVYRTAWMLCCRSWHIQAKYLVNVYAACTADILIETRK